MGLDPVESWLHRRLGPPTIDVNFPSGVFHRAPELPHFLQALCRDQLSYLLFSWDVALLDDDVVIVPSRRREWIRHHTASQPRQEARIEIRIVEGVLGGHLLFDPLAGLEDLLKARVVSSLQEGRQRSGQRE